MHFRFALFIFPELNTTAIESECAVDHLGICGDERTTRIAMEYGVIYQSLTSTLAYSYCRHSRCRTIDTEVAAVHRQLIKRIVRFCAADWILCI